MYKSIKKVLGLNKYKVLEIIKKEIRDDTAYIWEQKHNMYKVEFRAFLSTYYNDDLTEKILKALTIKQIYYLIKNFYVEQMLKNPMHNDLYNSYSKFSLRGGLRGGLRAGLRAGLRPRGKSKRSKRVFP